MQGEGAAGAGGYLLVLQPFGLLLPRICHQREAHGDRLIAGVLHQHPGLHAACCGAFCEIPDVLSGRGRSFLCEGGGYLVIRGHLLEFVACDRAHAGPVHQHIGYLKAGIGLDGEGLIIALGDRDSSGGVDGATCARAGGDGVGGYQLEARHQVAVLLGREGKGGVFGHQRFVLVPVLEAPALGGLGYEGDLFTVLVDSRARDRASLIGVRRCGDGPQLGELRLYGVVSGHILEGVGIDPAHRFPVHQHIEYAVAVIRVDGEGLVVAIGDGDLALGLDGATCARRCGDDPYLFEGGRDGMVRGHVLELVAGDLTYRITVHLDAGYPPALVRGDGEGLVVALGDGDGSLGVDGAARVRACGDGPYLALQDGVYPAYRLAQFHLYRGGMLEVRRAVVPLGKVASPRKELYPVVARRQAAHLVFALGVGRYRAHEFLIEVIYADLDVPHPIPAFVGDGAAYHARRFQGGVYVLRGLAQFHLYRVSMFVVCLAVVPLGKVVVRGLEPHPVFADRQHLGLIGTVGSRLRKGYRHR